MRNLSQVDLVMMRLLFACSNAGNYSTYDIFLTRSFVLLALLIWNSGQRAWPTNLISFLRCYLFRYFHLRTKHFLSADEFHVGLWLLGGCGAFVVTHHTWHLTICSRHFSMKNVRKVFVHGAFLVCIAGSFPATMLLLGTALKDFEQPFAIKVYGVN